MAYFQFTPVLTPTLSHFKPGHGAVAPWRGTGETGAGQPLIPSASLLTPPVLIALPATKAAVCAGGLVASGNYKTAHTRADGLGITPPTQA